jgi:hypothetical protein
VGTLIGIEVGSFVGRGVVGCTSLGGGLDGCLVGWLLLSATHTPLLQTPKGTLLHGVDGVVSGTYFDGGQLPSGLHSTDSLQSFSSSQRHASSE